MECSELISMYEEELYFRSRVDMARYWFGNGEYKYFQSTYFLHTEMGMLGLAEYVTFIIFGLNAGVWIHSSPPPPYTCGREFL